jgi:putative transposase
VQRVERHILKNSKSADALCFLSKNLYNYVLYLMRQHFFKTNTIAGDFDLINQLTAEQQADYKALPAQSSQQVIRNLRQTFYSFLKMRHAYAKNPKKFSTTPALPKYKDKVNGRHMVIFTSQQCKLVDGYIYFPKRTQLPPLKTKVNNLCQVRIVPQSSCCVIEVVYEKEVQPHDLDETRYLSIDLGINNLATITTNQPGLCPILVKGKLLKSINQYYNKKKAVLQSYVDAKGTSNRIRKLTLKRNFKVQNYLHHVSKFIINYCLENKIKNIVIGNNKEWKQSVNMGKTTNQKFVCIPYSTLIKQIQYKAEEQSITVLCSEESYTSKCDALSKESVKKHTKYKGKRVKRGMFNSGTGVQINADVNGSLNILRKVIGDDFISLLNTGRVLCPVSVNPLTKNTINSQHFGL